MDITIELTESIETFTKKKRNEHIATKSQNLIFWVPAFWECSRILQSCRFYVSSESLTAGTSCNRQLTFKDTAFKFPLVLSLSAHQVERFKLRGKSLETIPNIWGKTTKDFKVLYWDPRLLRSKKSYLWKEKFQLFVLFQGAKPVEAKIQKSRCTPKKQPQK